MSMRREAMCLIHRLKSFQAHNEGVKRLQWGAQWEAAPERRGIRKLAPLSRDVFLSTELYQLHPQVGRRLEPEKRVLDPRGR